MNELFDDLARMNDAEYVLNVAVEVLALHEQGEKGYSLEELIFEHYNATVGFYPRGGGVVKAFGGVFRNLLTIEYSEHTKIAILTVDKMIVDGVAVDAPYNLSYKMKAEKFVRGLTDVKKEIVDSRIRYRTLSLWKDKYSNV